MKYESQKKLLGYLLISMLVLVAGCAVKNRDIAYYAFNYPSPDKKESESPVKDTLMIYRFLPARSVSLDSLVVSQDKEGEQTLFKYRWEENPADMIADLILRDLQSAGLFERVVDQLSSVRYRYALEGNIKTLQGIIKDGKARAVLQMELMLTDFEAPTGRDKTILKKSYKIEAPSKDTEPESIIKAMNTAIEDVSQRLRTDIRLALENAGALRSPGVNGGHAPQETRLADIAARSHGML
jgi:ABC-type uncharacterized transport system auxiliary subunit